MSVELEGTRFEGDHHGPPELRPVHLLRQAPVRINEGAALDNGTLSLAVLRRAAQRDMPTVAARVFSDRHGPSHHRQIDHAEGVTEALVSSISEDEDGVLRRFPVQVDGDYIGDFAELRVGVDPGALTIVALASAQ